MVIKPYLDGSEDDKDKVNVVHDFQAEYASAPQSIVYEDHIKVDEIRAGVLYTKLDEIAELAGVPIHRVLSLFDIPQTTYNKRKREAQLMGTRDTELTIYMEQTLRFGLEVFNDEIGKYQHWLDKPIISLGGVTPLSLFDSITGIERVRDVLYALEYGNLA